MKLLLLDGLEGKGSRLSDMRSVTPPPGVTRTAQDAGFRSGIVRFGAVDMYCS